MIYLLHQIRAFRADNMTIILSSLINVKGGEESRNNWIGLLCQLFAGGSFQREAGESTMQWYIYDESTMVQNIFSSLKADLPDPCHRSKT